MRTTQQKTLIYDIIMGSSRHPSAEMVFEEARVELPNISLGTVYRVLRGLSEEGKILRIPLEGGDRFDKMTFVHSHFECIVCGEVTDIECGISGDTLKAMSLESGNEVMQCNAVFRGICAACVNKNKNEIK